MVMQQLPSKPQGYALDLDSTHLLHDDGHQNGIEVGYTRIGTKPCLHPLPTTKTIHFTEPIKICQRRRAPWPTRTIPFVIY